MEFKANRAHPTLERPLHCLATALRRDLSLAAALTRRSQPPELMQKNALSFRHFAPFALALIALVAVIGCAGGRGDDADSQAQQTAIGDALDDLERKSDALAVANAALDSALAVDAEAFLDVATLMTDDEAAAATRWLDSRSPEDRAARDRASRELGEAMRARLGATESIDELERIYHDARTRFLGPLKTRNVGRTIGRAMELLAKTPNAGENMPLIEWMNANPDSEIVGALGRADVLVAGNAESTAAFAENVVAPSIVANATRGALEGSPDAALIVGARLLQPGSEARPSLYFGAEGPFPVPGWWQDRAISDVVRSFYSRDTLLIQDAVGPSQFVDDPRIMAARDPLGIRPAVLEAVASASAEQTVSSPFAAPTQRTAIARAGAAALREPFDRVIAPRHDTFWGPVEESWIELRDSATYSVEHNSFDLMHAATVEHYRSLESLEIPDPAGGSLGDGWRMRHFVAGKAGPRVLSETLSAHPDLDPTEVMALTKAVFEGATKEAARIRLTGEALDSRANSELVEAEMRASAERWLDSRSAPQYSPETLRWMNVASKVLVATMVVQLLWHVAEGGIGPDDILPFTMALGMMSAPVLETALAQFAATARAGLATGATAPLSVVLAEGVSKFLGAALPAVSIVLSTLNVIRAAQGVREGASPGSGLVLAGSILSLCGSVLVLFPPAAPVAIVALVAGAALQIIGEFVIGREHAAAVLEAKRRVLEFSAMSAGLKSMLLHTNAPGQLRRGLSELRSDPISMSAESLRRLAELSPATVGGQGPLPPLDGLGSLASDFALTGADIETLLVDRVGASGARSFMVHQFVEWLPGVARNTRVTRDAWLVALEDQATLSPDPDRRAAFAAARDLLVAR